MRLELLGAEYSVVRLAPEAPVPQWARGELVSVTRTPAELSIVCEARHVPREQRRQGGWRCLAVVGPLAFDEIGVLARLTAPLADAGISVLGVGTYDTDYLLVPGERLGAALDALRRAGWGVPALSAPGAAPAGRG